MRSAIQMLIEVCKNSRKLYEQEFENVLLTETSDYFRLESNQLITDTSCASYLDQAHKRLQQEYERINSYLSPSTEQKLINTFLNEYIGEQHSHTLLTMEATGLVSMIRDSKIEELALLYSMFSRRDASFELLRNHIRDYIADEGSKLV